VLTSFVPSATVISTSSKLAARSRAASVMAAIQPWSAAGAENPMRTVSPVSSLPPGALVAVLVAPSSVVALVVSVTGSFPVQPTSSAPTPTSTAAVWVVRRQDVRRFVAVMLSPSSFPRRPCRGGGGTPDRRSGGRWSRAPLRVQHGSRAFVVPLVPHDGGGRIGRDLARRCTRSRGGTAGRCRRGASSAAEPARGDALLEQDGEDDDHAAGDGLRGAGQVVEREHVAERREDQDAED